MILRLDMKLAITLQAAARHVCVVTQGPPSSRLDEHGPADIERIEKTDQNPYQPGGHHDPN